MDEQNPQNPAPERRGTGFVNLQKYLQANQGNDLDNYVGNKIHSEVGQYQDQFNKDETDFQNQLGAYNQGVQGKQADIDRVMTDPTKANDNDVSNFEKYRATPVYGGPTGLANADQHALQAEELNQVGNQAKSGNVRGILSRYLGGSQYSAGKQNFDSMLMGDASNMRKGFTALGGYNPNVIRNTQAGNAAAATNAQAGENKVTSDLRSRLGISEAGIETGTGELGTIKNDVTSAYNDRLKQYDTLVPKVQTALTSRDLSGLTQDQLAQLGLTGYRGNTYDVDASRYLTPVDRGNITQQSVATTEQQARLAALSKLSGVENSFLPDASKVGTMDDEALYGFNKDQYLGAVANRGNEYTSTLNNTDVQYQNGIDRNGNSPMTFTVKLPWAIQNAQQNIADAKRMLVASQQPGALHPAYEWSVADQQRYIDTMEQRLAALQDQKAQIDNQFGANNKFKFGALGSGAETGYIPRPGGGGA